MSSSVRESTILFLSIMSPDFITSSKSSSFCGDGSLFGFNFAAISVELPFSMPKLAIELLEPPSSV